MPYASQTSLPFLFHLVAHICLLGVTTADTFTWQGNRNDNFGNERNWAQNPGSGDIPGVDDRMNLEPGADRYRIDLGGNPRNIARAAFETDGSTGSGGYNWEFLNQTLTMGSEESGLHTLSWKHTTNTNGSISIGGDLFILSGSTRSYKFIGSTGGSYNLVIHNSLGGRGTLVLDTFGSNDTLTLKSQNSYSGKIILDEGTLVTEHTDPFPNASISASFHAWGFEYASGTTIALDSMPDYAFPVMANRTLTVEAEGDTYKQFTGGGILNFNNKSSGSSSVSFTDTSSFNGTLNLNTTSSTFTGGLGFPNASVNLSSGHTLNTTRDIDFGGLSGGGVLNLNNSVITIGGAGPTVANTLSSKITGNGVIALDGGSKILVINNNANTFSGLWRVSGGDELSINATALQYATLDLNSLNNPLTISANNTKLGALKSDIEVVLNKDLAIGQNNSSCSMVDQFSGSGTLTKVGSGTFTFNGANTSSGKTLIQEGSLAGSSSYTKDLEVQSELSLEIGNNSSQSLTVGGTFTLGDSSTLRISPSGSQTAPYYPLVSYNNLSGRFNEASGLPDGYYLDYSFRDSNGNTMIALVRDTTPPVVTLNGERNLTLPISLTWTDPGASAVDAVDGVVEVEIEIGSFDGQTVGTYELTYTATDAAGNSASVVRTVTTVTRPYLTAFDWIVSTSPTKIKDHVIDLTVSEPLIGLTVDDFEVSFSGTIGARSLRVIDETRYCLTYNSLSGDGELSVRLPMNVRANETGIGNAASLTLTKVIDQTAPVISLNGEIAMKLNYRDSYSELGATATDNLDGIVSVTIGGDTVDTSRPGNYSVSYRAVDTAGNVSTSYRVVTVIDTQAPVIIIVGEFITTLEAGDPFIEKGATAIDETDGDIEVTIGGDTVNTQEVGEYTITYTASDTYGNRTTVLRLVKVIDSTPPVITTSYGESHIIGIDSEPSEFFPDPKAQDAREGVLSVTEVRNTVDLTVLGSYEVVYEASDSLGNTAQKTLAVHVVDQTSPIVTLNGDREVFVEFGEEYAELGATAYDNIDGELEVVVAGETVKTNVFTIFGVTYQATDKAGNRGEAYRSVEIRDTTPPLITLNGAAEVVVKTGSIYNELGAIATDATFGSKDATIGGDVVNTAEPGIYYVTYDASDWSNNKATQQIRIVTVSGSTGPTDISFVGTTTIPEDLESIVGRLSASDPDDAGGFTYSLVSGEGDESNEFFAIEGEFLRLIRALDYETQPQVSFRVEVADGDGQTFSKAITLRVRNLLSDDDDGDGLVEGAEDYFGTDPLNADTDGDGIDDNAEISDWKTDPLDSSHAAFARIKEINPDTGRTSLELQIADDTSCAVYYSTTLNAGEWQSIGIIIQGTGTLTEVDFLTPSHDNVFYRITLE